MLLEVYARVHDTRSPLPPSLVMYRLTVRIRFCVFWVQLKADMRQSGTMSKAEAENAAQVRYGCDPSRSHLWTL